MSFHQTVQNFLLTGHTFPTPEQHDMPPPPRALAWLIDAVAPSHHAFNQRAIACGHRYRSAFWAIYLLSAVAVLCAVMPLALGWDDPHLQMSRYALVWVVAELLVIGTVALLYWQGQRQDWQGQWLAARTKAELVWYMPLIAPLLDSDKPEGCPNWYGRLFNRGHCVPGGDDIDALCHAHTAQVHAALANPWAERQFMIDYACWTIGILEDQRRYHLGVRARQHALLHRVHSINTWLFGITAVAALSHLLIHSRVLTLMTTVLPALGAALHGALAQSEAYRLEASSERLARELANVIAPIRTMLAAPDPHAAMVVLRAAVRDAVELIMDEHEDWHLLVTQHHLPLG